MIRYELINWKDYAFKLTHNVTLSILYLLTKNFAFILDLMACNIFCKLTFSIINNGSASLLGSMINKNYVQVIIV